MSIFVSPAVIVREQDLSLYIPNLSTTICAIVGTSLRGPENEATFCGSVAAFTRTFGNPHPNHLATYAALQYLRYGRQLYFVRVNGTESDLASVTANGEITQASVTGTIPGTFDLHAASLATHQGSNTAATRDVTSSNKKLMVRVNGGSAVTITLTENTGVSKATIAGEIDTALNAYGADCTVTGTNQITISGRDYGSTAKIEILSVSNNAYTLLGLTVGVYYGEDDNLDLTISSVDRSSGSPTPTEETITLTAGSARTAAQVVADINGTTLPITAFVVNNRVNLTHDSDGQDYGILFAHDDSDPWLKGAAATLGFAEGTTFYGRGITPEEVTTTFNALATGSWGNNLSVVISAGSATDTFKVTVKDSGLTVEVFDNLVGTPEDENKAQGIKYIENAINGISQYISVTDEQDNSGFPKVGTYDLTGGDDGLESVSDDDFIGTESSGVRTGLQTLTAEAIDVNLILVPGISSAAVINEVIALSTARGDCMGIVDPPLSLPPQSVVDWHNGQGVYSDHASFNSSYAALYWPWLQVYDAFNDVTLWTPPSGHMAGIYAFSDQQTEVWFAPAGYNRGVLFGTQTVEFEADKGDTDLLYGDGNAVNFIKKTVHDGLVCLGQRTLQRKPSATDRVNVRRLMLYLRKVVSSAVKYLQFEPIDDFTMRSFSGLVRPFLENVQARRGIIDFRVVCDASTNPPAQVDQNILGARVYIKPTKAAEWVLVDMVLTSQGANFDELVTATPNV